MEENVIFYGFETVGNPAECTMVSQPDYVSISNQQPLYSVALPYMATAGSQFPILIQLPQTPVQFQGKVPQPEFFPVPSHQSCCNMALPVSYAPTVGPQVPVVMQLPQEQVPVQVKTPQFRPRSISVPRTYRNGLPSVPTVRISQNPQFVASQHRNLISLTATPPTTSGSLPRSRGKHYAGRYSTSVDTSFCEKAFTMETSVSESTKGARKTTSDEQNPKALNDPKKRSSYLPKNEQRFSAKVQNNESRKSLLQRKGNSINRTHDAASNARSLFHHQSNRAQSYYPEEGSSPLTTTLHSGLYFADNEASESFRPQK